MRNIKRYEGFDYNESFTPIKKMAVNTIHDCNDVLSLCMDFKSSKLFCPMGFLSDCNNCIYNPNNKNIYLKWEAGLLGYGSKLKSIFKKKKPIEDNSNDENNSQSAHKQKFLKFLNHYNIFNSYVGQVRRILLSNRQNYSDMKIIDYIVSKYANPRKYIREPCILGIWVSSELGRDYWAKIDKLWIKFFENDYFENNNTKPLDEVLQTKENNPFTIKRIKTIKF